MSLRLLLDEDLSGRVAEGLRLKGVDALSVHELNRTGLADEQQLTFATAQARVPVTYNRADSQILDAQGRMKGLTHTGILWEASGAFPVERSESSFGHSNSLRPNTTRSKHYAFRSPGSGRHGVWSNSAYGARITFWLTAHTA